MKRRRETLRPIARCQLYKCITQREAFMEHDLVAGLIVVPVEESVGGGRVRWLLHGRPTASLS
jgi:hypothetical protein